MPLRVFCRHGCHTHFLWAGIEGKPLYNKSGDDALGLRVKNLWAFLGFSGGEEVDIEALVSFLEITLPALLAKIHLPPPTEIYFCNSLYEFHGAGFTKHQNLNGLKNQKFILSQHSKLEMWNKGVPRLHSLWCL